MAQICLWYVLNPWFSTLYPTFTTSTHNLMKTAITTLALALLTAAGILATTTDAQAQNRVRTGIKGGLSASTLQFNNVDLTSRKERIGFHAGLFTQIPVGSAFAIQPELLYVNKGASSGYRFLGQDNRASFNLNYIDLPVLATIKLGDAVEIQAGPYVSYLLNTGVSNTGGTTINTAFNVGTDQFNRLDYGLAGGLNIYFGQVLLGARYTQGLQQIANSTASRAIFNNAKNGVGMLSIGYSFN